MKRITKESLATAFQITAIVFLFGYSFSPVKVEQISNVIDATTKASGYSTLLQQKMDNVSVINLSYAKSKAQGLLYTRLNIATDFIVPTQIADNNAGNSTEPGTKKDAIAILYAMSK